MRPLLETDGLDILGLLDDAYANGASVARNVISPESLQVLVPEALKFLGNRTTGLLRADYAGPYPDENIFPALLNEWGGYIREHTPPDFFTIPPVQDFTPDTAELALYPEGHRGVADHSDGKHFYNLITIIDLLGEADFNFRNVRLGSNPDTTYQVTPGDIVLMRAKGLKDYRGGQIHGVVNTQTPRIIIVARQFAFLPGR